MKSLVMQAEQVDIALPLVQVFEYFTASIILGIILMVVAVWSSRKISEKFTHLQDAIRMKGLPKGATAALATPPASTANGVPATPGGPVYITYAELILGSANVLFLCFGMTGIMILVNNNLARAFAIGAAIAVIRFRIKFDSQGLGSSLFFGVLVGMACGVGQVMTAIGITTAFCVLQVLVVTMMRLSKKTDLMKVSSVD